MTAAAIDRFGPPDVLTLHTLPLPQPGPSEVLIALHGAGVGEWDAEMRAGNYTTGKECFPLVPGTDGAGIVAARGARVRRFDVDDRVWAYEFANPKGGFYAEFVAVKAEHVAPVPQSLSLLEAAASAVTGLTALQGIDDHLAVREEETVLVFGATGAVGTLAVQFAKLRGARVIGTATGRDAVHVVTDLGADGTIDGRSSQAAEQLRALAPQGVDAVLALAGGDNLERCLELLQPGGRVAYPNGVEPEPKRRAKVRSIAYDAVAGPREFAKLNAAVEESELRVIVGGVYPLERAAEAHQRVEHGHVIGRLALRIRDTGG
jgi:NADPH:quinone reductase-like Zn-dependent oxidoreductase